MHSCGRFSERFKQDYLRSLSYYRSFYDDVCVYGNPQKTKRAIYFIPGFNGVPGQVRFALPSLTKMYGIDFFLRGCYLPEFSANLPVWDKYLIENVKKKIVKITKDISGLLEDFASVIVVTSSSGFYDFFKAYSSINKRFISKLRHIWIACSPDVINASRWENLFFPLNGFVESGFRWWAFPNHDWLKFVNPECSLSHRWKMGSLQKTFYKHDLEVRFHTAGVSWSYASIECMNSCLRFCTQPFMEPVHIPTVVLAATQDGYWQGKPQNEIKRVIDRYIQNAQILFRSTSHLWITNPEYLYEALEEIEAIV